MQGWRSPGWVCILLLLGSLIPLCASPSPVPAGRKGKTGIATTFINKNQSEEILLDLKHLLKEAKQRIPPVLQALHDPMDELAVRGWCGRGGGQPSVGLAAAGGPCPRPADGVPCRPPCTCTRAKTDRTAAATAARRRRWKP